jgi:hypothetical protein
VTDDELTPEEFLRRLRAPISDSERSEMQDLVRWFSRRYPTPKARLDYARRKYAEWTKHRGTRARTNP